MSTLTAIPIDLMGNITIDTVSVYCLKPQPATSPEFIYNNSERLIEELDAEAKHMRSLGLFG